MALGESLDWIKIKDNFHLGGGNGMEWNDHKGMEMNRMDWNGIYLSKGKEWNRNK